MRGFTKKKKQNVTHYLLKITYVSRESGRNAENYFYTRMWYAYTRVRRKPRRYFLLKTTEKKNETKQCAVTCYNNINFFGVFAPRLFYPEFFNPGRVVDNHISVRV